jgi:hypothetical protein
LRNRLGKGRSGNRKIWLDHTVHAIHINVRDLDRRFVDRDIVEVNNGPGRRSSYARESHIEEQTMIRCAETTQTEDFFMGYPRTIEAADATDIPGLSNGDTSTGVHAVNVLACT